MNYEQRKTVIFEWLFGQERGQLRSYEAPEFLSNDRRRDEINNMVEDINSEITSEMTPNYLSYLLGLTATEVRKKHKGRKWPTINTFCLSIRHAQERAEPQEGNSCGQINYDFAVRWWKRFKSVAPATTKETTERLLSDNIITFSDAFKSGFPMGGGTYDKARDEFLGAGRLDADAIIDGVTKQAGIAI